MPFFDGAGGQVHYRRWQVQNPRAGMVFLHGSRQHSGQYHRFARGLNALEIEVWALDHLGHGLSEGVVGELAPIEDLAHNAALLIDIARRDQPDLPLTLMGHSLGAVTAVVALAKALTTQPVVAVILCGTTKSIARADVALPGPATLLVHGVDDRLAPIDAVREWVAGSRKADVELREYADAGHDLLHEPVHATVTADLGDYVARESFRRS
ncbi:alpha/beta hydrolase [Antrihabitans spumae]|jgi:alpha-beta hydrolase superfamily lysophospholipase|uniref:Alpha/beta hydrolase n=1 Tax=Antrihabitans spumae TaxID=3373370 RepID=A0ABW7KU62_9NOCA